MSKSLLNRSIVIACMSLMVLCATAFPQTIKAAESKADSCPARGIPNPSTYSTVKTIKMIITAYSSTPEQTDDTPFITASGKRVADGIIANNMLPFGTKVRIPGLYGDKVFIVEDRMHKRKGLYHADIWFPEYQQAKEFGAKLTHIEVLES